MMRPLVLAVAVAVAPAALPVSTVTPQDANRAAQPPSPPATAKTTFPSTVELVTVDVAVVDRGGKAVPALTRDDFLLSENGTLQTLTSFESVVLPEVPARGAPPPPRRSPVSTNVVPKSKPFRTFVVVFDDIHLSPVQALRAKAAIAEFLQSGVVDGDRVTLVATGGGAWWNARMPGGREQLLAILKRLDGRYIPDSSPDRLTEYEAMRIEEYQDVQVADKVQRRFDNYGAVNSQRDPRGVKPPDADSGGAVGLMPELIRSRAQEVHNLSTSRNKITLGVMTRAIEALAQTKGRKAMILVSQGFIYDAQLGEMRKLVEASTRANVPVYFIDTRGLQALPEAFTAAFGRPLEAQDTAAVLADITLDAEGAAAIALDTGGFVVKNSNDLASGIKRVSSESRAYYLLGYSPRNLSRDGKFRKIEVKLRPELRSGLTVRARRGYYAPLEGETSARRDERDPAIAQALDSPFDVADVPLRASSFVFDEVGLNQLSVQLAIEVDVSGLAFRQEAGRATDALAFLIEAQHLETGEYYRYDQKIEMSLLPETLLRLQKTWYPVSREFTLPPGGYQAKIVVRDLNSGRVGSLVHEFEVPSADHLRVSTPVLSNVLETGSDGSKRPLLRVSRSFASGTMLYCQYGVYGAEREKAGLMPHVTAGYEIRRSDGAVFKRASATPINPTSVGALLRLSGISLRGASPGDYDLVLTVRDQLSGKAVEVREPFTIVPG